MLDLTKLIEQWENSALELREAETLINLLIVDNRRLEKLCASNNRPPNQAITTDALECELCGPRTELHTVCVTCGSIVEALPDFNGF